MSVGNVIVSPENVFFYAPNFYTVQPKIVPDCCFCCQNRRFRRLVSYVCGPSNFVRIRGLDGPGTIHKHSLQFTDRHMHGRKNPPDSRPHQIALQSSSLPLEKECEHRLEGPGHGTVTAGKGEIPLY
jgi:hypothetical protein